MTNPDIPIGSTTMLEVLNDLRRAGFAGQLIAKIDGTIRCTSCNSASSPSNFSVDGYRRLEGASDAADMNLIVWANCPNCGNGGALILGYGPNASDADSAVLPDLNFDDADEPGVTPS